MMQQHVHENRDWAQNTSWMPAHANVTRVNWENCHIENWDYQWFLDQTHRAPHWEDLPHSYRQWWLYQQLPHNYTDLGYYLRWLNYEPLEYDRKLRQLQRWIDEWNNMSQFQKMAYFNPILPTAYVHERKMQVGDRCGPNPYTLKIVGDS